MFIPMHDLPHLPCSNLAPMALCMSMWMHVHDIKQGNHKINPNSNMWKVNKQTSIWNKDLKLGMHEKWFKIEAYMLKQKQKKIK